MGMSIRGSGRFMYLIGRSRSLSASRDSQVANDE
jgi:hypothetical protein